MIANVSAFALARHWRHTPVYDALLERDGICLQRIAKPLDPPIGLVNRAGMQRGDEIAASDRELED